ncbi:MAG: hypothetical protein ACTHNS_01495 [Marmoricola sp.]
MNSRRPSFTELVDWLEERLPHERAAEVEAAVADGDADLHDSVAWIRGFHHDRLALPLQPVPADLQGRLRSVFTERRRPWDPTGYLWSDTVTDSRDLPAAAGFRSSGRGGVAEARRLTVQRDEVTLVLDVVGQTADGLEVTGSVRRPAAHAPGTAAVVTFTSSGQVARRLVCDEAGAFHAALVPSDVDEVWVDAGDDLRFRAEVGLTLR